MRGLRKEEREGCEEHEVSKTWHLKKEFQKGKSSSSRQITTYAEKPPTFSQALGPEGDTSAPTDFLVSIRVNLYRINTKGPPELPLHWGVSHHLPSAGTVSSCVGTEMGLITHLSHLLHMNNLILHSSGHSSSAWSFLIER